MIPGNLDNTQKKHFSRNFKNPKKFWKSEKNWNSRFQNFEKIDLIILPNRSNRSNRKKSPNRLGRFIGQRINMNEGSEADTFQWKETFELWALSFETEFENVTASGMAVQIFKIFETVGIPRSCRLSWERLGRLDWDRFHGGYRACPVTGTGL